LLLGGGSGGNAEDGSFEKKRGVEIIIVQFLRVILGKVVFRNL
jgi:hypothetical protein